MARGQPQIHRGGSFRLAYARSSVELPAVGVVLIYPGTRLIHKKLACTPSCNILKLLEAVDIEGLIYFPAPATETKPGCGMRCCFTLYKVPKC